MPRGIPKDGRRPGRPIGAVGQKIIEIKKALSPHIPEVVDELVRLAKSGESEQVRLQALNSVLDRYFGKPKQAIAHEGSIDTGSADAVFAAVAAALDAVAGTETESDPSESDLALDRSPVAGHA